MPWSLTEKDGKAVLALGEKECCDPLIMSAMGRGQGEGVWLPSSIFADYAFHPAKNILTFLVPDQSLLTFQDVSRFPFSFILSSPKFCSSHQSTDLLACHASYVPFIF